jgi:hypothetical protein
MAITGKNRLQLWCLLKAGGAEWPELLRPRIEAAERDLMIEAGFLNLEKEIPDIESLKKIRASQSSSKKKKPLSETQQGKDKDPGAKKRQTKKPQAINRLYLTDKGREYLLNHLGESVSKTSPNAGPILSWILAALDKDENGKSALTTIMFKGKSPSPILSSGQKPSQPQSHIQTNDIPKDLPKEVIPEDLLEELKRLSPSLFMASGGLKISVIKENFKHYSPQAIDQALLALEKNDLIVLFHFDDPLRITPADKELGLHVSGVTRHYLYIK